MLGNYYDLTIKQFLNFKSITELESDPVLRNLKLLALIEDKTLEEVEDLPIGELVNKVKKLSQIEALKPDEKVKMTIKLKGKKYRVKWKQQDLTAAQYIDATHFCKDSTKITNNIHNILAAISVEVDWLGRDKPYNGSKHKEVADLFYNHMKISQAYPIMLFFCKYYKELAEATLTYLEQEAKQAAKVVMEKHSAIGGDGLQ
ncbi:MAG: hypothetical protein ACK574_04115 [Bacteroidota bacterium]